MIHVYEKCNKTDYTPKGLREIGDKDLLKKGPCIIMIPHKTTSLHMLNNYLIPVAQCINPNYDCCYDPNRRVFGIGYGDYLEEDDIFLRDEPNNIEIEEFVDKCFTPLFMENGEKLDVLKAMKNFRNITFLTYCAGANHFIGIEKAVKEKMNKVGYTKSEINMILSQICLAAISGYFLQEEETSALSITFGDKGDSYFINKPEIKSKIEGMDSGYINYLSSMGYFLDVKSDLEEFVLHDYHFNMLGNRSLSSKIKVFLKTSLDNALSNIDRTFFEPITYEKMAKAFASAEQPETLEGTSDIIRGHHTMHM